MDDLPEKLRALYVAYGTNYVQAAADTIESLRQRLADKHRLFMCASENYDRLAEQLAECERERDELVAAMKDAYPYEKHLADGCDCPWCKALAKVGSDKGGV